MQLRPHLRLGWVRSGKRLCILKTPQTARTSPTQNVQAGRYPRIDSDDIQLSHSIHVYPVDLETSQTQDNVRQASPRHLPSDETVCWRAGRCCRTTGPSEPSAWKSASLRCVAWICLDGAGGEMTPKQLNGTANWQSAQGYLTA